MLLCRSVGRWVGGQAGGWVLGGGWEIEYVSK